MNTIILGNFTFLLVQNDRNIVTILSKAVKPQSIMARPCENGNSVI